MHISDVRKFLRCPRMYQYSLTDNQKSFPFFNIICDTDESIINKLNIKDYYLGQVNETNEDTLKGLSEHNWLVKARFSYRGLRCRVPFLYHEGDRCDLYFSSLTLNPTDGETDNILWTASVVEKCGLTIDNIYIIYLNREYVRHGELEHDKLWSITDSFFNANGHASKNILGHIRKQTFSIDLVLDQLLHFDNEYDDTEVMRTSKCTGRSKCRYYERCFPEEKDMPDNSILTLVGSQYKYDMYRNGIRYLADVNLDKFEGSAQQYAQIMADKNNGLFFDKVALNSWLNDHTEYPLSFIDFEWDLYPIPPFDNMRPMEVLPFQYSLDIMQSDGSISHHEFIGEMDCRRQFVENMLKELPDHGTIFAYNALGAEVLRLKELSEQFPEYSEKLMATADRFVDLAMPFINGVVYHTGMRGLYSLKVIQSIIDKERSYHDLQVENGLDAVSIHRKIEHIEDPELKREYYDELYKYCGLDSYALVEVYDKLKSLV